MADLMRNRYTLPEGKDGIHDDNHGNVYIKVDKELQNVNDADVANLMFKKMAWQERNPNKRVVAMAIIPDSSRSWVYSVGLLIHYE
ncbi:MAG: hypothetical protein WAV56_03975 [Microgenomates group bacterium]